MSAISKSFHLLTRLTIIVSGLSLTTTHPATAASLDLQTWQSLGDVEIESAFQANLSTDALSDDDFDLSVPSGTYNFSGNPAAPIGFGTPPFLENFLGIAASQLDLDIENIAYEGSGIKTTLTNVNAGDKLSFNFNFFTNETAFGVPFADYAFLLINQDVYQLANHTDAVLSSSLFDKETGNQTYTYTFIAPGTYTVGFGVIDLKDFPVTSGLSISDVSYQAAIPEPLTFMGVGVAIAFGTAFKKSLNQRNNL